MTEHPRSHDEPVDPWRVRAIFEGAEALPEHERESWVRSEAGLDTRLAEEVLRLLSLATDGDRVSPSWIGLGHLPGDGDDRSDVLPNGSRIGPYSTVRLIGRGGMGVVYEAERDDDQFRMSVALKLLPRGAVSSLAIRRFRYERQLLASLRHPNIASMLDGGITDDGQPYIAMELVKGQPITDAVQVNSLGLRERVSLMIDVCAAVGHAHSKLIVHRDLKPGNILVDGERRVRLLDFGIARLLREADDLDLLPATEGNVRAFTRDYASPEQFTGEPPQLGSDIYSLGVVMYELFAGRRPYSLSGLQWEQQLSLVTRQSIPCPSEVADPTERRLIRGDLDAIVLHAMAQRPEDRYQSVELLSADLSAWLSGLPISVRKPGTAERLLRTVRRRPVESTALALTIFSLMASAVWSSHTAAIAHREQQRTESVNSFLQSILISADPDVGGRSLKLVEALQLAERRLASDPPSADLAGDLHFSLASAYYGLGEWVAADSHATRALQLRREALPSSDPRIAEVIALQGVVAEARGDVVLGERLLSQAVVELRRSRPRDERRLADALGNHARLVDGLGQVERSEALVAEEIAMRRASRDSAVRAGIGLTLSNLAVLRTYQGRLAEAESLQRLAIEEEAVRGRDRPRFAEFERGLADILEERGQYGAADSLMRHSLPLLERHLGTRHTTYLRAAANTARLRVRTGNYREALAVAQPVVEAIGTALPSGDPTAASVLQFVGAAHDSLGEFGQGEAALRRAWDLRKAHMPAGHWAVFMAQANVGAHLLRVERYNDAEQMLLEGYHGVAKTHGAAAPYSRSIANRLSLLYAATGRRQEASRWQRLAVEGDEGQSGR